MNDSHWDIHPSPHPYQHSQYYQQQQQRRRRRVRRHNRTFSSFLSSCRNIYRTVIEMVSILARMMMMRTTTTTSNHIVAGWSNGSISSRSTDVGIDKYEHDDDNEICQTHTNTAMNRTNSIATGNATSTDTTTSTTTTNSRTTKTLTMNDFYYSSHTPNTHRRRRRHHHHHHHHRSIQSSSSSNHPTTYPLPPFWTMTRFRTTNTTSTTTLHSNHHHHQSDRISIGIYFFIVMTGIFVVVSSVVWSQSISSSTRMMLVPPPPPSSSIFQETVVRKKQWWLYPPLETRDNTIRTTGTHITTTTTTPSWSLASWFMMMTRMRTTQLVFQQPSPSQTTTMTHHDDDDDANRHRRIHTPRPTLHSWVIAPPHWRRIRTTTTTTTRSTKPRTTTQSANHPHHRPPEDRTKNDDLSVEATDAEYDDDDEYNFHDPILQLILQAKVSLIDLRLDLSELRKWDSPTTDDDTTTHTKKNSYNGIYGTFCYINMTMYKHQPHLYPMYNDLIRHSPECTALLDPIEDPLNTEYIHTFTGSTSSSSSLPPPTPRLIRNINLRRMADLARRYDDQNHRIRVNNHHTRRGTGTTHMNHHTHHKKPSQGDDNDNDHDYTSQKHKQFQRPLSKVQVLNVTSVIFHESRCGSTLLTNLLTTMDMTKHRVYSEPRPILQAIQSICGEDYAICSPDTAAAILQDTIYIMSRSSTRSNGHVVQEDDEDEDDDDDMAETKAFFKFPSIASRNIPVFIKAFPNVPYILLYRNPMEVMVSHFHPTVKDSSIGRSDIRDGAIGVDHKLTTNTDEPNVEIHSPLTIKCLSQRHSPGVSIVDVVQKYNRHQTILTNGQRKQRVLAKTLNDCDYCAAHLASMTEMMVTSVTSQAIVMNYRDVTPQHLYTNVFPKLLLLQPKNNDGNETDITETKARIELMASLYSKNRFDSTEEDRMISGDSNKLNKTQRTLFVTDTDRKQKLASVEIRTAVTKYLLPSYLQLEALAQQQLEQI